MDNRDFRVRCKERFTNFGVATGLKNQLDNQMDKTVGINVGKPNQEIPFTKLENHYDVIADENFPPDNEGIAIGVFGHMKDALAKAVNPPEWVSYCQLERCGHRLKQNCEIIERYEV